MKRIILSFAAVIALVRPACALTPGDLSRVTFEQHPGVQVSGDLAFRDESDRLFQLGDHFGKQPTILVLGYYGCPMLCSLINDGLIQALQELPVSVGKDFQVIDVSIDPAEKAAVAAAKKSEYLRQYGRPGAADGWHFLVGDKPAIAQLADQVGFRYAYDPQIRQYAHPSGVVVLTRDGKISRYVFGVRFDAKELRDALVAAKDGKSSSIISQVFLLCYHYNPITGKYGGLILSILRFASLGFLAAIAWWIVSMSRRSAGGPAQIN
ncbi:MAG TPA: SCO family protein [Candidatus Udaeobacter sp.]|jgi:protein SCO1/2